MAGLAQAVFIDPATGRLREFFDEAWRTIGEDHGRVVEPGHQFEWAWLLVQYGRRHNDADALQAARRLYAAGREGVSERHRVAVDALNDDGSVRTTRARLWPQTEWLRGGPGHGAGNGRGGARRLYGGCGVGLASALALSDDGRSLA
nr:AGE family epimerase/isomerase [Brevundimonas pondensis]